MFNRRFLSALAFASLLHAPSAYSLELTEQVDASAREERLAFVSIQNASAYPVSITLSNGETFDLRESRGKLLPCADISGLLLFVNAQSSAPELSATLNCGHIYTVKDDAQ